MTRLLPALLLTAVLGSPTLGEPPAEGDAAPDSLLARLGDPAEPEAVDALLATLPEADTEAAMALASALGHAGGCAAARALQTLLRHRLPAVRCAALVAARRAGLRREALVQTVRRLVREDQRGPCTVQAVETLGHIGDGRDVELLLGLARSDEVRLRRAAYRALASLTGAAVPYVHARWSYFWKSYRTRSALVLPQVLVALEMDASGMDAAPLCDLVRTYGWVDLVTVRDHLSRWVVEPDPRLRGVACRLIADLRLADLAPEVESAYVFAAHDDLRNEARRTLGVLGAPVPEPSAVGAE